MFLLGQEPSLLCLWPAQVTRTPFGPRPGCHSVPSLRQHHRPPQASRLHSALLGRSVSGGICFPFPLLPRSCVPRERSSQGLWSPSGRLEARFSLQVPDGIQRGG